MGGGGGKIFGKKIGPAFAMKNSRMDHKKKKKAGIRPAEAEKVKGRKIERAREIEEKGI